MARVFTIFLVGLCLSLAAPSAHAEIVVGTDFFGDAQAYVDRNGDGFLLDDEGEALFAGDGGVLSFSASLDASSSPSESSMRQTTNISASATSVRVASSGTCEATTTRGGAYKEAEANSTFQMSFAVTETTQLSISGSFSATGDGVATWNVASIGGEAVGRGSAVNERLTLEPGQYYAYVACDAHAYFDQSRTPSFAKATAGWSLGLTLTERASECEAVSWAGARAGAFASASNWEPPRVPLFDEGAGRCDDVVIRGGRGLVLDLAAAASPALSAAAAPAPIRRVNRFTVDAHRELQPIDGTIEGVELSPVAGERSVEVINGASLLLNGGGVFARHLGVGSSGEGGIEVVSPRGYLETTGRLGLGIEGSGSLLVRDGGTVIAAEAVLGEQSAQGSITVQGAASTLDTGSIAVGLEDDGALRIEAGGVVTSETGVIGFDLDGDERGRVAVDGASSQWTLSSLDVRPRGSLDLFQGGRVTVNGPLSIGAEGAPANCEAERACVTVVSGVLQADGVVVGDGGGGELVIAENGRVATTGSFTIGTGDRYSVVRIAGNLGGDSVFTDLAIATAARSDGSLRVGRGGRLDLLGRFRVGGPPDSSAYFSILGDPANAEATQVSALDGTGADSIIGGPTASPSYGGGLTLESAVLEILGSGHDLVIERNGRMDGGGGRVVFDAGGKLVNRGRLDGDFVIEGDFEQAPEASLSATLLVVPSAGPAQAARGLAPAAAPPPPPFRSLVVTGNATLAGKAKLQFGNGVAPKQGDQFELLRVDGEVTGAFDEVEIAGLAPGAGFASEIVNGALVLTSLTDAEPLPYVNLAGKPVLLETRKAAKLKLTRSGDTSAPLTVAYTVAGSAESGVDYMALPGTIQFPARKKSVTLLVQPIADGVDEGSETIEITLAPDASFAPGLASALTLELRDGKKK
jgi:T5SS/PEP-CTERM-associated repeat protein